MRQKISRYSLFSQPLDRSIFVGYFLGAVVPLAALAWVAQRWVAPNLETPRSALVVLGLLSSIGVLSLASFLAVRRVVRTTIARLDRENTRLSRLLEATRSLAIGGDDSEILQLATAAVAMIANGDAGHIVVRLATGELDITESNVAGSSDRAVAVLGAAEQALESRGPAMRGADTASGGLAVAVPCALGPTEQGALVAWHASAVDFEPSSLAALSMLSSSVTTALRDTDAREAERNFFTHATSLLVTSLDN